MAVPHLDSRFWRAGRPPGPYATWTTKFLHRGGSFWDLPSSIKPHNWLTLLKVGIGNLPLVGYLSSRAQHEHPPRGVANFYPDAKTETEADRCGNTRPAIKKEDGDAGIVHFGTEVVTSSDKSVSALLGACRELRFASTSSSRWRRNVFRTLGGR